MLHFLKAMMFCVRVPVLSEKMYSIWPNCSFRVVVRAWGGGGEIDNHMDAQEEEEYRKENNKREMDEKCKEPSSVDGLCSILSVDIWYICGYIMVTDGTLAGVSFSA